MAEWFLVAGGPSLTGFDWERLRGKYVIAVNRAFEVLPFAQVLYWTDWRFFSWYTKPILAHRARRKITGLRNADREHNYGPHLGQIEVWRITGPQGIDRAAGCLRHGNNAGFAAINLSVHLGAHRIYLLGYDMKATNVGPAHWHDGYPIPTPVRAYANMIGYYPSLVEPLRHMGIEVVNLNPESALECFPKRNIDEVL